MNKEFKLGPIVNIDFLTASSVDLDNGEVKARLDLSNLRSNLQNVGMQQLGIASIMKKLERYANQVSNERAKGIHVGSTSLASGLSSEIFVMKPQELGLQTDTEVKLVARLVYLSTQDLK